MRDSFLAIDLDVSHPAGVDCCSVSFLVRHQYNHCEMSSPHKQHVRLLVFYSQPRERNIKTTETAFAPIVRVVQSIRDQASRVQYAGDNNHQVCNSLGELILLFMH